jgi:hypothetical protein
VSTFTIGHSSADHMDEMQLEAGDDPFADVAGCYFKTTTKKASSMTNLYDNVNENAATGQSEDQKQRVRARNTGSLKLQKVNLHVKSAKTLRKVCLQKRT